jgi:ligand-binding sensor domain-containing protein/signal transduction histidine kinase
VSCVIRRTLLSIERWTGRAEIPGKGASSVHKALRAITVDYRFQLPEEARLGEPWMANSNARGSLSGSVCEGFSRTGVARGQLARLILCVVTLVFPFLAAHALERTTPLANLNRQGWVMENGLPQNTVQALAQTADGFLWIGTEVGLVRFDGSGFAVFDQHSRPALPGSDIRCLLAAKDGSLWIGTSDGLARLKDGAVTTFNTTNGLPGNEIQSLGVAEDGGVIVSANNGEVEIRGTQFAGAVDLRPVPADPALAPLFQMHLADGSQINATKSEVSLKGSHGNREWRVGRDLPGTRIQTLFADRENFLWIGTNGGLVRYTAGHLETFPLTDPLASASILTLLEDREGNLWVGTESTGLQILRDQRFHTLTTRDGLASDNTSTVVQDTAGTLWVGTAGSGLTALHPGASPPARTFSVRDGLLSDVILSLAVAPNGDLWTGTPDGLNRIRRGAVASFTSADGLPDDFIRSLLADSDGSLWIGTRRGLTHWGTSKKNAGDLNSPMQTWTQANGLGSDLVGAMVHDTSGDLWIATFAGLSRLHNGQISNFTTANGLSSNVITALLARPNGTLVVGTQDHGWDLWDGSRFNPAAQSGISQTTIHALLDDGRNHLWFATASGLARCDMSASATTAACSDSIEFSATDGLRSRETASNSHPSAWKSADGRLWFATPKGLVEVDPAHFPVNAVPPPVAIERFAVDDADQVLFAAAPGLRIAAGHNHFQFEYAGLSFTAPQKVHYRYMLEGFDRQWTEAGSRRTAYYTSIPPGHYTFRVQAANNDGLWNASGASLAFELRPHFYQTIWFYAFLVFAGFALVFLVLRLRLLRAQREFNAVLGERNRIAREIHDTLAQGYVGVSIQLEVLSELLKHNKLIAAAQHLDTTRAYVREGIADARQSIWALRSHDSDENTLPVRMRRLVEQAGAGGLESRFNIYGAYRPFPPGTESEILRIAQEAVQNAKKHAAAQHLTTQLAYSPTEISLEVRDDGRGFDMGLKSAQPDSPPGHYGLTGMRERAATIGGWLDIETWPGEGTVVRLRVLVPKDRFTSLSPDVPESSGTPLDQTPSQSQSAPDNATAPRSPKE